MVSKCLPLTKHLERRRNKQSANSLRILVLVIVAKDQRRKRLAIVGDESVKLRWRCVWHCHIHLPEFHRAVLTGRRKDLTVWGDGQICDRLLKI